MSRYTEVLVTSTRFYAGGDARYRERLSTAFTCVTKGVTVGQLVESRAGRKQGKKRRETGAGAGAPAVRLGRASGGVRVRAGVRRRGVRSGIGGGAVVCSRGSRFRCGVDRRRDICTASANVLLRAVIYSINE